MLCRAILELETKVTALSWPCLLSSPYFCPPNPWDYSSFSPHFLSWEKWWVNQFLPSYGSFCYCCSHFLLWSKILSQEPISRLTLHFIAHDGLCAYCKVLGMILLAWANHNSPHTGNNNTKTETTYPYINSKTSSWCSSEHLHSKTIQHIYKKAYINTLGLFSHKAISQSITWHCFQVFRKLASLF